MVQAEQPHHAHPGQRRDRARGPRRSGDGHPRLPGFPDPPGRAAHGELITAGFTTFRRAGGATCRPVVVGPPAQRMTPAMIVAIASVRTVTTIHFTRTIESAV